jgi:uncharacterized ferritin-like protein (DUF455 family)
MPHNEQLLTPELFGEPPRRDERFLVKELWAECHNLPDDHPDKRAEFLHRQMNEEINGMEMAARNLSDFPNAPWELRMSIARQCCDEARHVDMFRRLVEKLGKQVGSYPVMNFQYRIVCRIPSLEGRLAVQNKTFEAGGIDAVALAIREAEQSGDADLLDLFEFQEADEITHVRFANEHLRKAIHGNPRVAIEVAKALTTAMAAFAEVMGEAATKVRYDVNTEARLEAGFLPEELKVASDVMAKKKVRQAGA